MVGMPAEPDVRIALRHFGDIRKARAVLRLLIRLPTNDPFVVDTLLAASEIVSNALEHTVGTCAMSAWFPPSGSTIRIEVSDCDADADLTAQVPAPDRLNGRGLAIVATVSSRWGCERTSTGKTVWVEVDRKPLTASRHS